MKALVGLLASVVVLVMSALPVAAYSPPVISCSANVVTVDYTGTGIPAPPYSQPMETIAGHWVYFGGHATWVKPVTHQGTWNGYLATFKDAPGTDTFWIYVQYQSQIDPVTVSITPCP